MSRPGVTAGIPPSASGSCGDWIDHPEQVGAQYGHRERHRPRRRSSKRTVTIVAGCPAASRRLRATAGGGGCISMCSACGAGGSARASGSRLSPSGSGADPSARRAGQVAGQVGRRAGGRLAAHGPQEPDHADRCSVPGRPSAQAMSSGTRRQDTWRLRQARSPPIGSSDGAQPGHALQLDQVLGRAGPVQLAVREPPDQVPADQLRDGVLDLGRADVIAAGQRGVPRQPPARLMVHQGRGEAVGEHGAVAGTPVVIPLGTWRHALITPSCAGLPR